MTDPNTSEGCMKAAWAALLRGDTTERDRLIARCRALMRAEQDVRAVVRVMVVDFYIAEDGTAYPTVAMAKAAHAIQ